MTLGDECVVSPEAWWVAGGHNVDATSFLMWTVFGAQV